MDNYILNCTVPLSAFADHSPRLNWVTWLPEPIPTQTYQLIRINSASKRNEWNYTHMQRGYHFGDYEQNYWLANPTCTDCGKCATHLHILNRQVKKTYLTPWIHILTDSATQTQFERVQTRIRTGGKLIATGFTTLCLSCRDTRAVRINETFHLRDQVKFVDQQTGIVYTGKLVNLKEHTFILDQFATIDPVTNLVSQ